MSFEPCANMYAEKGEMNGAVVYFMDEDPTFCAREKGHLSQCVTGGFPTRSFWANDVPKMSGP